MSLSEFDLIERFFARPERPRDDILLGIGDDAALLRVPEGHELVVASAIFVEGRDFQARDEPSAVGHRALATALTRLAARGAEPRWASLALTLPSVEPQWLEGFSRGLLQLAHEMDMQLIGGDTTRGDRAMTLTAQGIVPAGQGIALTAPLPGDFVYVTGTLGDAGLAMLVLQDELRYLPALERARLIDRLYRPRPPVQAGVAVRELASAAAGTEHGLLSALRSMLGAESVGVTLQAAQFPISATLSSVYDAAGGPALPLLSGGDHELCFTISAARQAGVEQTMAALGIPCTWIGNVDHTPGIRCLGTDGMDIAPS